MPRAEVVRRLREQFPDVRLTVRFPGRVYRLHGELATRLTSSRSRIGGHLEHAISKVSDSIVGVHSRFKEVAVQASDGGQGL